MRNITFKYGELLYSNVMGKWIFESDDDRRIVFDKPMMHKVMDILGSKGWECIFITNNMFRAYFKKTIKKNIIHGAVQPEED